MELTGSGLGVKRQVRDELAHTSKVITLTFVDIDTRCRLNAILTFHSSQHMIQASHESLT